MYGFRMITAFFKRMLAFTLFYQPVPFFRKLGIRQAFAQVASARTYAVKKRTSSPVVL